APLPTVSVKPSVTGAMPAVTVGAVKVATATFAFFNATVGPAVCVQLYVNVRTGRFGSVAVPVNVTGAAEATVCTAPAFAVGAPISGLTVTPVAAVVVTAPLPTVTVKPRVTG